MENPSNDNFNITEASNMDKWQYYMRDCTSPLSYINFGFYYLIAASLQRRVWFGSLHHKPLFTNIYVIMVGKPGLGKDLVIEPVENILRLHKLDVQGQSHIAKPEKKDAAGNIYKDITAEDLIVGSGNEDLAAMQKVKKALEEAPLVLPIAANATTYEALVTAMAKAVRRIRRKEWSTAEQQYNLIPYSHCSLCFCLGEISSLFRKKTEDVVNFLLEAYNCKDNYEYDTRTQGKSCIRKLCLNLLGGTTPHFMESVFDDALLNEGFSSRAWFLFESENRFNRIFISHLTDLQEKCREDLIEHSRLLTRICGPVFFTEEAKTFLKDWWENTANEHLRKTNTSSKLDAYYARKQIHVMKMAMILHFSELKIVEKPDDVIEWDNHISIETVKKAIAILAGIEKKMHMALTFGGTNPLYKTGQRILRWMADKPLGESWPTIFAEFSEYANKAELEEILSMLQAIGKLETFNKIHPENPDMILGVYYRLAKPETKNKE